MTKFSEKYFYDSLGFSEMAQEKLKQKAFEKQVEPQVGLTVEKHTEAKDEKFNKEQELFYRATDYRGS